MRVNLLLFLILLGEAFFLHGWAAARTSRPTRRPSAVPTRRPSQSMLVPTTFGPTKRPTSAAPSRVPSATPTVSRPTRSPTKKPSFSPSVNPTRIPSRAPTVDYVGYFFSMEVGLKDISAITPVIPSVAPTSRAPTSRAPTTSSPTKRPSTLPPVALGRRFLRQVERRQLQRAPSVPLKTDVPFDLRNLQNVWFPLRQNLHCVVDYVLDLDGVDLTALRLYFSVTGVPLNCTAPVNFIPDAAKCFPMTVLVGVEARSPQEIQRYVNRNVSLFVDAANQYFPGLARLGSMFAVNLAGTKRGVTQFSGDEAVASFSIFDVFRNQVPTKCLDDFLNQTVRAQIESRYPSTAPTPQGFTWAPSPGNIAPSTLSPTSGGSDQAGLAVGLVFGLFIIPGMIIGGVWYYYRWRKSASLMDRTKDPLLPQDGSGSSSGPIASALRKNSRYQDSSAPASFSSGQLLPITSGPPPSTSGDFEFSIDLSKLKLGKVIGSGANGRIFQARYAGSDVAVKELFAHQSADDEDGADLKNSPAQVIKREFDNLRRLKHPHVIQLFGLAYARSAETGSPRYLLVMELADTSLDKVLNKKMHAYEMGTVMGSAASQLTMSSVSTDKLVATHTTGEVPATPVLSSSSHRLPTPGSNVLIHPMTDIEHFQWAMDIARQIASGLAFVHDRGLIHFDVKPHNILLDKAKMVKLCDLGISKMVTKQSDLTLTSPGRAGTPSYMSPELLRADIKLIGTAVDVYAFGIVLWQLLHLKPPHPKEWSIAQLFEAVLQKDHRPAIDPMTDPRTGRLIERCWRANPAERPNFLEIMKEIDEIVQDARPTEEEDDEFLAEPGEKLDLEEATFLEGDKVQVFSLAVGLVRGVVTGVTTEGGKKFYDVLLSDQSTMVGVCAAELIPLKKLSPQHSQDVAKKRPTPLETLDPKNATIGDVAAALAIARADERRRGRRTRRGSQIETGSSTILPPLMSAAQRTNSSATNSPKGSKGMLPRFGKRIWRSKEQASPSIFEMGVGPENPRTPPSSSPSGLPGGLSLDIAKSAAMNMPALTPFSLRFLRSDDDTSTGMRTDATAGDDGAKVGAAGGAGLLSQTFRYNGSVLEIKGLLVSEGGTSSVVKNPKTAKETLEDSLSSAGTRYAGKLFKIAELGHGASGQVHSALHEETFEIVAVKEVKFLADRAARHQTVREVKALQQLRHPNVVQFHASYLDPVTEVVCIVLEYVLGGSLQDLIEMSSGASAAAASGILSPQSAVTPGSHAATPVSQAARSSSGSMVGLTSSVINEESLRRIAFDLSSALAYCHGKLVAHLDVKPSNVLLTLSGSAKLADFGLARTFSEANNVHAATFVGTTKYMSPERLKGETYSFPADIWGLGLSLAAAAIGKFPIELPSKGGDSLIFFALLEKVRANRKIVTLPPDRFSPQAIAFVEACLRLDPEERPRADQLLSDFEWMQNVPAQPQQQIDRTACQFVMSEIAEAVAQRLVEIESRTLAAPGAIKVIEVQPSLVANLAAQLNLEAKDIRLELEAAVSKLTAALNHSVLSDTMNSRSSKESKNSRFAAQSDGGGSMRRTGTEALSDTYNSLLGASAKSPLSAHSSSTQSPAKRSLMGSMDEFREDDDGANGSTKEDGGEDDADTGSSPGLELHPL